MKPIVEPIVDVYHFDINDIISTSGKDGWLKPGDDGYNEDHPGYNNPNNPHYGGIWKFI